MQNHENLTFKGKKKFNHNPTRKCAKEGGQTERRPARPAIGDTRTATHSSPRGRQEHCDTATRRGRCAVAGTHAKWHGRPRKELGSLLSNITHASRLRPLTEAGTPVLSSPIHNSPTPPGASAGPSSASCRPHRRTCRGRARRGTVPPGPGETPRRPQTREEGGGCGLGDPPW